MAERSTSKLRDGGQPSLSTYLKETGGDPVKMIDLRFLLREEIAEKACLIAIEADAVRSCLEGSPEFPDDGGAIYHFRRLAAFARFAQYCVLALDQAREAAKAIEKGQKR
jgi:hypothetical protein